jgi:hypothetical protein
MPSKSYNAVCAFPEVQDFNEWRSINVAMPGTEVWFPDNDKRQKRKEATPKENGRAINAGPQSRRALPESCQFAPAGSV